MNVYEEMHKQVERVTKERQQKVLEILEQLEEPEPKVYKLDVSTIETLDDVKVLLNGLDMVITEESEHFDAVKKYFK